MSHPKVLLQIKRRNFSVFLASTLQCKSNQRTWSFIIQTNCWGFFLNKLRRIDFVALIIYIIHTLPFVFSRSVYPHNIASVQTITKLWVNQSLISSAHRLPQYGFRIQLNCGSWGWKLIAVLLKLLLQKIRVSTNRPFYRYGGHIEFIRFKEYCGILRGHSLSI